jgi:hypothetical protein
MARHRAQACRDQHDPREHRQPTRMGREAADHRVAGDAHRGRGAQRERAQRKPM